VFSVSTPNCKIFDESDFSNHSDEVSVAGRLSNPSAIKFFQSIGASDFKINILKEGHHPNLILDVPTFERRNNLSFRKHMDFATQEVKKLIASDRVEIVS
jgi:hypothetical protein